MNDREVMDTENLEKQEINMQDDVTKKVMEVLNAMGLIQPSNAAVTFGATNATEHLELNQWAPEDVPIRMDFNDDNRKIDTAFFELNTNLSQSIDAVKSGLSKTIDNRLGDNLLNLPLAFQSGFTGTGTASIVNNILFVNINASSPTGVVGEVNMARLPHEVLDRVGNISSGRFAVGTSIGSLFFIFLREGNIRTAGANYLANAWVGGAIIVPVP